MHALSWAHACVRGAAGKLPQATAEVDIPNKHDLHRSAQTRALPSHAGVWQPHPAAPQTRTCAHHSAQVIRAWEIGHRSAEVAVLKCRLWHAYARCHRNKKNLRAILRSGSELVSISDRILPLVACWPRARVMRACAVGIARRGAQIGRLGAPCKAGGRWCSLPHGCRCHRALQLRAIGGPVGRAALRLETGRAGCRSRTAQNASAPEPDLDAVVVEHAGPVGCGELATLANKKLFLGRWAARGEPTSRASGWARCFGREGTPLTWGVDRWATLGLGRAPSPRRNRLFNVSGSALCSSLVPFFSWDSFSFPK